MRKCVNLIALLVIILLSSCKKELSYEDPNALNGGAHPGDSLLVRKVINGGSDSTVFDFGYDASRRLTSVNTTSIISGSAYNSQQLLRRNTQGIVLQEVITSDSLRAQGLDSLVYNVSYDAAKSQYTSKVANIVVNNLNAFDSVAYTYDGSGKLIKSEEFVDLGLGTLNVAKTEYGYDAAGSVFDAKTFVFDSTGSYIPIYDDQYTYDSNVNPLKLGLDAFLIDDPTLFSNFNQTKDAFTYYIDPSKNSVTSFQYTYNTMNKPASAIATTQSGGNAQVSYYYQ